MAKYITTIPNTELSYCRYHYRRGLMNYKMAEKKKILDAKILAKKEKEDWWSSDYNIAINELEARDKK